MSSLVLYFDHCFVSCVLRVEQSVPEYNIRNTVFLKYHTNWDIVHCAVRSFTWSTILKPADPLDAFDRAIGEIIGWIVPTNLDKQWFDASSQRAHDAKQTAYYAMRRERSGDHWDRFVLASAEV